MKKILFLLSALLLLSACSFNNKIENNYELNNKNNVPSANLEYEEGNVKIYSFNQGLNNIDLNFDGIDDAVFVSHIVGADYYDYHVFFDRDIYSFYIHNLRDDPFPDYWQLVTKEIPDKLIADFERDFVIPEPLGINGGKLLRIAQIDGNTYLLIAFIEMDNEDIELLVDIYKLESSGERRGSDFIFSYVDTFIHKAIGNGVESIFNKEIFNIIEFLKSRIVKKDSSLTYNELMSYSRTESNTPGYFYTESTGKEVEWQAKISTYYSQITGIKFCVVDYEHQDVDINKPCNIFWASSEDLAGVDDFNINPTWDGHWVEYILNYYNVSFNEGINYYDDIYTVKGIVNGIDCAPAPECAPDIDIISIRKGY